MLTLSNTYSSLPDRFFARARPTGVTAPRVLAFNHTLAAELGLDARALDSPEGAEILSGNAVPDGLAPIAMAYAGHQFGGFVPQLGDGRAILLGEVVDRRGIRRDIQLKGAGRTAYSRGGDGRAALGPVLREYLVSEAMHALGIPTTRALAAVATGDRVHRETALPGAVLTRVAASHIRVGTFQFLAARGDVEGLATLADYVIDRLYPALRETPDRYLALLKGVADRQAELVARWMHVGFVHGVMNTDNSSISGETIDFGPCAFMDVYDPATVFSSIDQGGRYQYQNQPGIAQWNLARLAETLLPIIDGSTEEAVEKANQTVVDFASTFQTAWLAGLGRKIGLSDIRDQDGVLVQSLLDLMQQDRVDWTTSFRRLADCVRGDDVPFTTLFDDRAAVARWLMDWQARLASGTPAEPEALASRMDRVNPVYIPRNHLVEEALGAAVQHDNLGPFEALMAVLAKPHDDQGPAQSRFAEPGPNDARPYRTFCGT
ncbi:MAG: YdiU family protein [Rhizobium sp.]|nr:YdiU family protein [Rhizobium sp.]